MSPGVLFVLNLEEERRRNDASELLVNRFIVLPEVNSKWLVRGLPVQCKCNLANLRLHLLSWARTKGTAVKRQLIGPGPTEGLLNMLVACTILPQLCLRSAFGLFLREELLMLVDLTISGVCVIASRISLRATGSALILDLQISRLFFSSSSFPFSGEVAKLSDLRCLPLDGGIPTPTPAPEAADGPAPFELAFEHSEVFRDLSRDRKPTSELNEFKFKNNVIFIYLATFAAHFLWMPRHNAENRTSRTRLLLQILVLYVEKNIIEENLKAIPSLMNSRSREETKK
uniref:Uncharacterized protein n=1 Tax=Glossina austeni TaxID=7395 RepID=A0A1A9VUF1_GLOAU